MLAGGHYTKSYYFFYMVCLMIVRENREYRDGDDQRP